MMPIWISFQDDIVNFVESQLGSIKSTQRSLNLLNRFEGIGLPNLGIDEKYHRVIILYLQELDTIAKLYQSYKTDPPIARNFPPIAGSNCFLIIDC